MGAVLSRARFIRASADNAAFYSVGLGEVFYPQNNRVGSLCNANNEDVKAVTRARKGMAPDSLFALSQEKNPSNRRLISISETRVLGAWNVACKWFQIDREKTEVRLGVSPK